MGRPKGSKNKPKILKSPFKKGDPALDDLPPGEDGPAARIRYLAGRGLNANHIATLAGVTVEDVSPGGKHHADVEKGVALAVLAVAEKHYERVLAGKNTQETMFYLRATAKMAETAEGRRKVAAETGTSDEIAGLDIEFEDYEYDPDAPGEGEDEDENASDDMGEFEI
jgi:hypothetical protein